jgi:hypothetical protein
VPVDDPITGQGSYLLFSDGHSRTLIRVKRVEISESAQNSNVSIRFGLIIPVGSTRSMAAWTLAPRSWGRA